MQKESPSASLIDRRLVESIERAFAAHAGADARIDLAEMRNVLGLRTEAIARRMFQLFDVNNDGTITRDEFVAAVRALIAGTTRDKLAFAFRLHDENGDGAIEESELHTMVALGLAEDDVSVDAARVDHATRNYFAHADTNGDGRISFAEFEALTERYPALLAQMTRTEARWIAPNEDLLERFDPKTRPNRAHARANRRRQIVFLAIWIVANAALFSSAFLTGGAKATWLDRLGDACTSCIELDIGILVLAAMRRLLTWVRATRLGRVLPIDDAITFHRIVGHALFAFVLGHSTARIVSYATQTRRSFVSALVSLEGLTGLALVAMIATMWFFARVAIRRSHRFELFYLTHLLYLPFLIVAAVHAPAILAWGGVAIAGLLVEHALRFRARGKRARLISAITLRSGVTRLELAKPAGFAHHAGDYVFLRLPEIARHEWHPFTVSSAPETKTLTMHVRSLGNWTTALRDYVEKRSSAVEDVVVYLDGPYGSPSRHLFESRFAVMIGAGIGVTPFASILESIARRQAGTVGALEKAHFYWLNRDQYSFEWFAALLADLEAEAHSERLDIHIHMTGGHAGISAAGLEVARELLRERQHPDLVTGLQTKTHMGHPDWERELAAIQADHAPEPVHIYFCGPSGLGRTVAKIAARLGMPFREEKF